jgi:hypothetical protein
MIHIDEEATMSNTIEPGDHIAAKLTIRTYDGEWVDIEVFGDVVSTNDHVTLFKVNPFRMAYTKDVKLLHKAFKKLEVQP